MALYTDYQRNIDTMVKYGNTVLFDTFLGAEKHARQIRSYCYKVFNAKNAQVCWAVPK